MKSPLKNFFKAIFFIIFAVALFLLGLYFNKLDLSRWKPSPLVEQIPFGDVIEVTGSEEVEFYDSKNEFIGAEIQMNVKFQARIEPASKLPKDYKEGLKKVNSHVDLYVKKIPSKEVLERMKEALAESKYLRLIESEDVQATYVSMKIDGRRVKRIEKIELKPESYYFVKF